MKKVILKMPTSSTVEVLRRLLQRPSASVWLREVHARVSCALRLAPPHRGATDPCVTSVKPVVLSRSRRMRISGAGLPEVESSTVSRSGQLRARR